MRLVQQVTDDTRQKRTLRLDDGSEVILKLYYRPMQRGWFGSLEYNDFVLNNFRIYNSANILRQYRNIIPFGLACSSKEQKEPMFQEDFSSGNSQIYLLSSEEVDQYEDFLSE
tara:strand:- start:21647 stop:21985 length:339 start_codon:yes stop_codon:yes gene_type:complete